MPNHMHACPKCRLFLHVKQNGVCVEEGFPVKPAEGDKPAEWAGYKLWEADLWECEGCGFQLVTGFAKLPIAEHYQPTYQACRARHRPMVRIDDCPGGPVNARRADSRRACIESANRVESR